MVGEISDSFSILDQSVSRGSWGSRCASGSKTAGHTPRHGSRMTAHRGVHCFSNTSKKHGQPGPCYHSMRGADLEAQIAQVARRSQHRPGACSLCDSSVPCKRSKSIHTEHLGLCPSSPLRACRAESHGVHKAERCRRCARSTSCRCCPGD